MRSLPMKLKDMAKGLRSTSYKGYGPLVEESADRIEALEAENARLRAALEGNRKPAMAAPEG